jgi:glycosyltransferase involved in cell wall biosynthesis
LAQSVPLVSIIIPHLNQPEELRRCLSSLREQASATDRVEIIVVDNGSNTLPTDICASFQAVRLEQEAVPGPGPARNRGVTVSRGAILAFIDADCIADRHWLVAIAAALEHGDAEIIGGDVRIAFADPAKPTLLEAYESIFAYRQQEYIERYGFSGTGNLAMRRSAYDDVGPFAGIELAEDRDWGQRATKLGYQIRYVPDMVVFHPARSTFDNLVAKWDRHISHDFAELSPGVSARLRWGLRALAVGASPLFEMRRIIRSRRVLTWRERRLATLGAIQIRIHRAKRMLELLFRGKKSGSSRMWNRI